ncbi:unnamed protein product [Dovyalis caffra]|uniref:NADH dehydrogenase subunit 6 n=1 Tax=Dovyalis caffra TaxID=77055 RepID=A0AAV1RSX1_9ROSI|nr:unnamed protein product [Dovyalis caffra]
MATEARLAPWSTGAKLLWVLGCIWSICRDYSGLLGLPLGPLALCSFYYSSFSFVVIPVGTCFLALASSSLVGANLLSVLGYVWLVYRDCSGLLSSPTGPLLCVASLAIVPVGSCFLALPSKYSASIDDPRSPSIHKEALKINGAPKYVLNVLSIKDSSFIS